MENKEIKQNETKNKDSQVENMVKQEVKATVEDIFNFEEEQRDLRKVIKEGKAKVVKRKRRNGEDYYLLEVQMTPMLKKEVFIEQAELELMRMDKSIEVPANFVEEVGRKSGNVYYRLYIDISSDYRKYVEFSFAEFIVLKRIFQLV